MEEVDDEIVDEELGLALEEVLLLRVEEGVEMEELLPTQLLSAPMQLCQRVLAEGGWTHWCLLLGKQQNW